jgi:hypothetical protein
VWVGVGVFLLVCVGGGVWGCGWGWGEWNVCRKESIFNTTIGNETCLKSLTIMGCDLEET